MVALGRDQLREGSIYNGAFYLTALTLRHWSIASQLPLKRWRELCLSRVARYVPVFVRFLLDMLFIPCQKLTVYDNNCQNMTAAASDTHERSVTVNTLIWLI